MVFKPDEDGTGHKFYKPNNRSNMLNAYKGKYNVLPPYRVWNNERIRLKKEGLQHYGFRFQFEQASQSDFMQVPVLPDGHPLKDGIKKCYDLLITYPKMFRLSTLTSFKNLLAFISNNKKATVSAKKMDTKVSCCTCGHLFNLKSIVEVHQKAVRELEETDFDDDVKGIKKAMFHRMLWIPKYVFFKSLGTDPKLSAFANCLERIAHCLHYMCTFTNEARITQDMYPNDMYFDDTNVQRHNNIEWKVKRAPKKVEADVVYHSESES